MKQEKRLEIPNSYSSKKVSVNPLCDNYQTHVNINILQKSHFTLTNIKYYVTMFITITYPEKLLCNFHNSYEKEIELSYPYKPIPEQDLEHLKQNEV